MLRECLQILEADAVYRTTVLCESHLGKRGLYPQLSTRDSGHAVRTLMNLIAYADGTRDLIALTCTDLAPRLLREGLIEAVEPAPALTSDPGSR